MRELIVEIHGVALPRLLALWLHHYMFPLCSPLRDDEVLPVRTHRTARPPSPLRGEAESASTKKSKGKDKRKKKVNKLLEYLRPHVCMCAHGCVCLSSNDCVGAGKEGGGGRGGG